MKKIRENSGFTLIEVLIAMAISLVVGTAAYTVFSTSNWAAHTQEGISEAQQNVRAAINRLTQDIHTAGFGVGEAPISMTIGGTTFSSPITVTNSTSGPDSLTLLGIGRRAGILEMSNLCGTNPFPNRTCNVYGTNAIRLDDIEAFLKDTDGDGAGDSFDSNRIYVSIGGIQTVQLATTQPQLASNILSLVDNLTGNFADGDEIPVYILQAVQYSILSDGSQPGCTTTSPCLVSTDLTGLRGDGVQIVADGIEDMQFAYGVDVSPRDGKIDYSAPYEGNDFQNAPADDTSIVAVRATLVGRSLNPDLRGGTFDRSAVEDRSAGAANRYRQRSLTKVIMLKNPRSGA